MRREAALEREKRELVAIIQELERRCRVVVNREEAVVLKDVPSWKALAGSGAPSAEKKRSFRVGTRGWKDRRAELERKHRSEADRLDRRAKEFEQVLSGTFPLQGDERPMQGLEYTNLAKENSDVAETA
jgi:hypothetical protein